MDDNEQIDDLLSQLKENTVINKQLCDNKDFKLSKDDLEQFILNTSGRLIQDSLDMVDVVKERVSSAAEPDDVASLSELFKASTSTIEALNKILIQDKKASTTMAVKRMDIEAKKEISQQEIHGKLMASREEVLSKLIKSADVIDITDTDQVSGSS